MGGRGGRLCAPSFISVIHINKARLGNRNGPGGHSVKERQPPTCRKFLMKRKEVYDRWGWGERKSTGLFPDVIRPLRHSSGLALY